MKTPSHRFMCACLAVTCTCAAVTEQNGFCSGYRAVSWCPIADQPSLDAPQHHGALTLSQGTLTLIASSTGSVSMPFNEIVYRT
jgi:hypothetical protein